LYHRALSYRPLLSLYSTPRASGMRLLLVAAAFSVLLGSAFAQTCSPLTLQAVRPRNVFVSAGTTTVTLVGFGIDASSNVSLTSTAPAGAATVNVTIIDAYTSTITVPAALLASARDISVQVTASSGSTSNARVLEVIPGVRFRPAPVL
jgi:hypothetical protein